VNVIETTSLGKRFRRTWALRNCTLAIPGGHVIAVVGQVSAWLAQHHYVLWVSYQPASRFWQFQLIEGGGLLALAILLAAAALWLVRRA